MEQLVLIRRFLAVLGFLTISQSLSAAAIDGAAVLAAMNKQDRLPDDITRDARSQPQDVIPLLALETGDRVVDIFAGGGYYTELLASVVGRQGEAL